MDMTLEELFEKMQVMYEEHQGVDCESRYFALAGGLNLAEVLLLEYATGYQDGSLYFTKTVPIKLEDFDLSIYPEEVKRILREEMENIDPEDDSFPNFINIGYGETFREAIENAIRRIILLDYGWELGPTDAEYMEDNPDFFVFDDDEEWDDEEDEDWEDDEDDEWDDDDWDDEDEDDEYEVKPIKKN